MPMSMPVVLSELLTILGKRNPKIPNPNPTVTRLHFRIISHVLFPGLVRSLWRVFYLKLHFELKHQIVTTWTRYKTLAATEFAYWSWAVGKGRFLAREKKNQFTFKNHNSHPRWFGIDFTNQFPPQNLFSYIFNAVDSPLSILIPIEQKDKPLTQEVFAHVFFFSNTMRNKVEC